MLFQYDFLNSCYDFDQEVPDEKANLLSLAKIIYQTTQTLYKFFIARELVPLYYKDNKDETVYLDLGKVHEETWYRSIYEIKQLLYRGKVNGKNQQQFSINKGLQTFSVYEPSQGNEYKDYLQLLYFFYFLHYFIYPEINVFMCFSKEKFTYQNTYDEGVEKGACLGFIMNNLLSKKELFYDYLEESDALEQITYAIDEKLCALPLDDDYYDEIKSLIEQTHAWLAVDEDCFAYENVMHSLLHYLNAYTMHAYAYDLLVNIKDNKNIFKDIELSYLPPTHWQTSYIEIMDLDAFLMTDDLYAFCKQTKQKIEVRDKLKFINGNAVTFLKQLITYDQRYLKQHPDEIEGLCLCIVEGKVAMYALKAAIIIKTYYDLTYLMKNKLKSGYKEKGQSLRSALYIRNGVFATLPLRYFLLFAHLLYDKVITNDNIEKQQQDINVEMCSMLIHMHAYQYRKFEDTFSFYYYIYQHL